MNEAVSTPRCCIVISGTRQWCHHIALQCLGSVSREVLWIGTDAPGGIAASPAARVLQLLGGEISSLVFDAHSGFDPDAFGAVSGMIVAGGRLLLLTPPLSEWPDFNDPEYARITVYPYAPADIRGRFLRRLAGILQSDPEVIHCEEARPLPEQVAVFEEFPVACAAGDTPLNLEQSQAVAAVVRVVEGHRRRPLMLTADRGRGKSAAFGIAAARLLQRGCQRILVTAPGADAVSTLFEHAGRLLPTARHSRLALHNGDASIRFHAVDALIRNSPPADLLLVDEAAGIPTPLLQGLLERYARIAFASTVHGYEGTGRGFELRFRDILDRQCPGWRALELHTPIRWSPDDPLERLTYRLLLLGANAASIVPPADMGLTNCQYQCLDRDALANDEATLSELFGLLVLAHYRTRPYDLRQLLDGPNLSVHVLRHDGHIIATALLAEEGGIDTGLENAIFSGRRRLRGHLIPQSLSAHAGFAGAIALQGVRIMRIAVHPLWQRRGLGRYLLQCLEDAARQEGRDWIGACFGATPGLMPYWRQAGFVPLRLGMHREASSGEHAVLVLKGLSAAGAGLEERALPVFVETFWDQLSDPLCLLEPGIVASLLPPIPPATGTLSERERRVLQGFAGGNRGYEDCMTPILRLTRLTLNEVTATRLEPRQRDLLIARVLQRRDWSECARLLDVPGRRHCLGLLREAVACLLRRYDETRGI